MKLINSMKGSMISIFILTHTYFISRRWNKASNELQSHVISSRSRKAAAPRSTAPSSGGSILGAISDRVSRLVTGRSKEEASEHQAIVPATVSRTPAKRNYGFATSNLSHFSDRNSEDLYRYKNISSDYMRETSPTRNDDDAEPAATSDGSRRRYENVDRSSMAPRTRRSAARRRKSDDDNDNNPDTEEKP
jgi:hypothetical protein